MTFAPRKKKNSIKYSHRIVSVQTHFCKYITAVNKNFLTRTWDVAFGSRADMVALVSSVPPAAPSDPSSPFPLHCQKCLCNETTKSGIDPAEEQSNKKWRVIVQPTLPKQVMFPREKKRHLSIHGLGKAIDNYRAAQITVQEKLLWCCSKQVCLEYSCIFLFQSKMGYVQGVQYCSWISSCPTEEEQISDRQLRLQERMGSHSGDHLGRAWGSSLHFLIC